jgi:hypothetical protein
MHSLYLNARMPMVIGKPVEVTLKPGLNDLTDRQVSALEKTRLGKYLFDKEILSKRELNSDSVYTPLDIDTESLAVLSGNRTAKPEGKAKGKPISIDKSIIS